MSSPKLRPLVVPPEKRKSRRGYSSIPAIDPNDGKPWEVMVSHAKMDLIASRGPMHAKELAWSVREVLSSPHAVFQGVREEGEETWLCYVGRPRHAFNKAGQAVPPYRGEVFLVFVTDERVVYNWRWEKCDPSDPKLPEGYAGRFVRRAL